MVNPGPGIREGQHQLGKAFECFYLADKEHNDKKSAFVRYVIDDCKKNYPSYNVVVCRVRHSTQGKSIHRHVELSAPVGTVGFDIHYVHANDRFKFTRHGDGGWINWGFYGKWVRNDNVITHKW
jgi:hypothetical protein